MSIVGFDDDEQTTLEKVEKLQAGFTAIATSNAGGVDAGIHTRLRQELLGDPHFAVKLPDFVRRCRDSGQFWEFIEANFPTYRERREFIWTQFRPALDLLETQERTPGVDPACLVPLPAGRPPPQPAVCRRVVSSLSGPCWRGWLSSTRSTFLVQKLCFRLNVIA